MFRPRLTAVLLAGALLAGCQNAQDNPKQTVGTVLGAGVGGLLGSKVGSGKGQLAGVAIGALAGAFLGSEIGKSLDNADRAAASKTAQSTLENNRIGQTASWRNPDSGNSGTYTPISTYRNASGQDCREYETTITVDGKTERATGRACRESNGTWRIVQ